MNLRVASLSDIGLHRSRNEDRCLVDLPRGVFGVADGVGGVPGGAEAAQAARDTILAGFADLTAIHPVDLRSLVQKAHAAVYALGKLVSPSTGIATTLTVGSFRGLEVEIAHVGDSRCYCWHEGRFSRLTDDHSDGRVLTRCLGLPEPVEIDLSIRPLMAGDRYLFCTDGLSNFVPETQIAQCTQRFNEPAAIVQELITAALQGGGGDNISAVMVLVG